MEGNPKRKMKDCGDHFIEEMRDILNTRERQEINCPAYVRAAVIVPLFNKEGSCHILFTKRTEEVKHHKGQISFPGGAFDEEDGDLRKTALRETFEEIGLEKKHVRIIGTLDDIVTITKFVVTPFVGYFDYPYPFRLSQREIDELIEIPLSFLFDPECFSEREPMDDESREVVYTYQYGKHAIWGATARILKQFLALIPAESHVTTL